MSSPSPETISDPSTLELYESPGLELDFGDDAEDEEVPVRGSSLPVEESGPWNNLEEDDRDTPVAASSGSRSKPIPYGWVAGFITVAALGGFLYGLRTHRVDLAAVAPPTGSAAAPSGHGEEEGAPPPSDRAPKPEPVDATATVEQAHALYEDGDVRGAKAALEQVLAAQPDHAGALVLLSNLRVEEGDLPGALEAAQSSVRADPEYPDAYLALGVIQQELGAYGVAAGAYRKYLELAPDGLYANVIRRQLRRVEAQQEPTP